MFQIQRFFFFLFSFYMGMYNGHMTLDDFSRTDPLKEVTKL